MQYACLLETLHRAVELRGRRAKALNPLVVDAEALRDGLEQYGLG